MSITRYYHRWNQYHHKWQIGYMARRLIEKMNEASRKAELLKPAIDISNVSVLTDAAFRTSVARSAPHTMLDVARLANLWCLAQTAGEGSSIEVGSYRGGSALHICHARPDSPFYCFDPFEDGSFEEVGNRDGLFSDSDFTNTSVARVRKLLSDRNQPVTVVKGYFPASAKDVELRNIAFCHLDVDVYKAMRESLEFISDRLAPRSVIVLDDYQRNAPGVDTAVAEFLSAHPRFACFPAFPGQGVVFSSDLWK